MHPLVGFDLVKSYWSGIRCSIPWWGRSWLKYAVYSLTTRSKCLPSWISIWSMHSRRRLPMNLSQTPFAWGVRYGVFTSLILPATAEKCVAYYLSRSRIRYFGPFPHGVASRNCCAVHSSVGYFVTPVCIIRRVFNSNTTKIYHCRNNQSFTTVKSQDQLFPAWFFRNVAQLSRKGIGTMWPDECSFLSFGMYRWTVRLLTSIPSISNSPRIRSAPHNWFSFAIFSISAIVSAEIFGLPCDFRRQYLRNNSRCQRKRVSGWTMWLACFQNVVKCDRNTRPTRSRLVSCGRLICRFSTISCWATTHFLQPDSYGCVSGLKIGRWLRLMQPVLSSVWCALVTREGFCLFCCSRKIMRAK